MLDTFPLLRFTPSALCEGQARISWWAHAGKHHAVKRSSCASTLRATNNSEVPMPMYTRLRPLFALIFFLIAASVTPGQVVFDGNQNLPPFGGFSGSDLDIVSLQNGNLH